MPRQRQDRRHSTAHLIAIERNISYKMSESLKQAGGNEALEKPVEIKAALGVPAHAYDLRTLKYLGHVDTLTFTLDPWRPSLFASLPEKVPVEELFTRLAK